jgi:hypothetical protein
MIVAWRIAYLMRLGRTCRDLGAAMFFDQDEIHGAYLLMKNQRRPQRPRLNEVVRLVAQCGGFLACKGDGDPGAKTIRHDRSRGDPLATQRGGFGMRSVSGGGQLVRNCSVMEAADCDACE